MTYPCPHSEPTGLKDVQSLPTWKLQADPDASARQRMLRAFQYGYGRQHLFHRQVALLRLKERGGTAHQVRVESVEILNRRRDILVAHARAKTPSEQVPLVCRRAHVHHGAPSVPIIQGDGARGWRACIDQALNF